jgi:hypothetical protein
VSGKPTGNEGRFLGRHLTRDRKESKRDSEQKTRTDLPSRSIKLCNSTVYGRFNLAPIYSVVVRSNIIIH